MRKYASGWIVALGFDHLRFKSTPASELLEFPITTPSGFTIGTNLIMVLLRILSYFFGFLVIFFKIFYIMKLEWVSDGCCLA